MANASTQELLDSMFAVAASIAPLVADQKTAAAIQVASNVITMIDTAREAFDEIEDKGIAGQLDELLEQRDALEKRVNEHVDSTAAHLRGQG